MNDITEEEAQQYDRQIRLWGAEAQKRLKAATVMIIGVNGLSSEVIKNLVLAGINTLAVCDTADIVSEEDVRHNFLITHSSVNEKRANSIMLLTKSLNPRVKIESYDYMPKEISNNDETTLSINNYDIIICCVSQVNNCQSNSLWNQINESCRKYNKLFFAMDSFGWFGLTFVDLGRHNYIKDEVVKENKDGDKPGTSNIKVLHQVKEFCSFGDISNINWSKKMNQLKKTAKIQFLLLILQKFVSQNGRYPIESDCQLLIDMWHNFADLHTLCHSLVSDDSFKECLGQGQLPVNAVLGGLVTQEIIKAISGKNEPFGNFILFNGVTCAGDATFMKP